MRTFRILQVFTGYSIKFLLRRLFWTLYAPIYLLDCALSGLWWFVAVTLSGTVLSDLSFDLVPEHLIGTYIRQKVAAQWKKAEAEVAEQTDDRSEKTLLRPYE